MHAVSVSRNGSTVTGPVLIYRSEIASILVAANDVDNGLTCRSTTGQSVAWYLTDGAVVGSIISFFTMIRTGSGVTPSISRLLRSFTIFSMPDDTSSGLITCRLNGAEEGAISVGIYLQGGGE